MAHTHTREECRAEIETLRRQPTRRLKHLRTFLHAARHHRRDFPELLLRVDRANVGVLVDRIAHAQDLDPVLQLREYLLRHRLMHEQPRAGATHVALIKENPVDDALDRLIQRRVVEHDVRRFATEFQGHLLVRARERAHDDLADFRRPRERNLRRDRVIQHRRPDVARARHEIHHARRQARVLQNFCQFETRDRRRLGRLQHDCIPHRQRRREFPRQHEQREIPRNHLAHHTERRDPTTRRHVVEFVRPTGVIKKVRRRHRYIEIP